MKRILLLLLFTTSIYILNAATYTSIANGNWNIAGTWNAGDIPAIPVPSNDEVIISAGTAVTLPLADGNLTVGNSVVLNIFGTLNIDNGIIGSPANNVIINVHTGGVLNVGGDINENDGLAITVSDGGVMNVSGAIDMKNNGVITADGTISVSAGIVSNAGSTITFNGDGTISGGISSGQNSTLNFNGNAQITGDITSAKNSDVLFNGLNTIDGNVSVGDGSTLVFDGHTTLNGNATLGSRNDADGIDASLSVPGHLDIYGGFTVGNKTDIEIDGKVNFYTTGNIMTGFDEGGAESNFLMGTGEIYYQNPSDPAASRVLDIDITTFWNGTWPDTPLPIVLAYFDAEIAGGKVALNWRTESEKNNDFFVVMRSDDGGAWSQVSVVDGFGNSSAAIDYQIYDTQTSADETCYKLVQVDLDGTETEVAYDCVSGSNTFELNVSVYPNPAVSYVTVEAEDIVSVYLFSSAMELVSAVAVEADIAKLDLSTVSSGAYLLVIKTSDKVYSENLLVR